MDIQNEKNFLIYIDNLNKKFIADNKYINKDVYHHYINIESKSYTSNIKFICLKKKMVFFLLKDTNGTQFYLDDHDIISMIISIKEVDNSAYDFIISNFESLLEKSTFSFSFFLNDKKFTYPGLNYYEKKILVKTKADIDITLNDLIHLLNLILVKEFSNIKSIICRYITFSRFYSNECKISKNILSECGYDTTINFEKSKEIISIGGKKKFNIAYEIFKKYK